MAGKYGQKMCQKRDFKQTQYLLSCNLQLGYIQKQNYSQMSDVSNI